MAVNAALRIVKSFGYRDETREWGNTYHLSNGVGVTEARFHTLADAVVTAETALFPDYVTIVRADWIPAGSDTVAFTKTYSTVGSGTTAGHAVPGDVAAIVRYDTLERSTRNHPIYCFNYYHSPRVDTSDPDSLVSAYLAELEAYADQWSAAGFSDGSVTHVRALPGGGDVTGYNVNTLVTHRDLRRP